MGGFLNSIGYGQSPHGVIWLGTSPNPSASAPWGSRDDLADPRCLHEVALLAAVRAVAEALGGARAYAGGATVSFVVPGVGG